MHWSDDDALLTIDGTTFRTLGSPVDQTETLMRMMGLGAAASTGEKLVLLKPRSLVERYVELMGTCAPERVVDLGIFEGGSVALIAKVAQPSSIVAVDIRADRVAGLDEFAERNGLDHVISAHYGIDQGDVATLAGIVGPSPIDLVLDDCSHLHAPTVAAFDLLFRQVRPGGLYVIEDWSWGVVPMATPELTDKLRTLPTRPLAAFLIDVILVAATRPDVVARVTIDDAIVVIERGPADLEAGARLRDLRWDELEVDLQLPTLEASER